MQTVKTLTQQQEVAYSDYVLEESELDFWIYYKHWCYENGYFYDA